MTQEYKLHYFLESKVIISRYMRSKICFTLKALFVISLKNVSSNAQNFLLITIFALSVYFDKTF